MNRSLASDLTTYNSKAYHQIRHGMKLNPRHGEFKLTKSLHIFRTARELIAIFTWTYIISKLFLFDIDRHLIEAIAPQHLFLLQYKLLFILGATTLLIACLRTNFYKFALYVCGYPFVVIFYKLPLMSFKNWEIVLAFFPAIYSFLSNFKSFLVHAFFFLLSSVILLKSSDVYLLIPCMVIIFYILSENLFHGFSRAYRANIFNRIAVFITKWRVQIAESDSLVKMLENSKRTTPPDVDPLTHQITTMYIFHSGASFVRETANSLIQSRKVDLYLMCSWFISVLMTWLVYSLGYYSLFKIDNNMFSLPPGNTTADIFSFLGYSFGKVFPYSISQINPVGPWSTALSYSEICCSLLIIVILVFTILTVSREKYKDDLLSIADESEKISTLLQDFSFSIFNLAINEAEKQLVDNGQAIVNHLRKLRGLPAVTPTATTDNS